MKNYFILGLFMLVLLPAWGQKITLSGYVQDDGTGEKLIGASVFDTQTGKGALTNEYGFFSLTLPQDSIILRVSYVGYQPMEYRMAPNADFSFNINLKEELVLDDVVITAGDFERIENQSQMSAVDISIDKIKSLPVLMGEKDVMKVIQLMPGVQSGTEGTSGIYVRGGGPDQNLILLDGVPVYNASHLFGFFSVFNADAINSVRLIKGGFPAHYGGRLSSVIDIRMKEGNMKKFHGEGTVGLISSKLTLEGPIIRDKTSFIVSARRTYADLLARPFIKAATRGEEVGGYYFYDVNAKINHKFNENSRLYLSGYFGDDKFFFRYEDKYLDNGTEYLDRFDNNLNWGNIISAVRWNRIINPKLFLNATGTYSRYRFNVGFREYFKETSASQTVEEEYVFNYLSGINDWGGKLDFDWHPSPAHAIKFGVGDTYHTFTPGVNQFRVDDNTTELDTTFGSIKQFAHEATAYFEDDWEISNRIKVNAGLHWSGFLVGEKFYNSLQPRISGRFLVGDNASIKASYSRMTQFLHLLTNPTIGLPTDLWVPVTENVPPQTSDQVAIGYAQTIFDKFQISVEGYYKTMENLIEYKEGASFFGTENDWQDKIEVGRGWSYGGEILLEKKLGKTSGWIGYTLSWTNRQFENLNFGEVFPYRYDRRHDIGVAITHEFNDRVDVGLVWVYGTGNAVTLGLEKYTPFDNVQYLANQSWYNPTVEHVASRNNYRMPGYHRLDVGVNLHKETRWGERTWSLGLYNAYNRQNPFFLYFSTDNQGNRGLYQVSIFPVLPSVAYSFKF